MPANLEQIHSQLQKIGNSIEGQSAAEETSRQAALQRLHKYAAEFGVRRIVEAVAKTHDPNLRCALPVSEKLDVGYSSAPVAPSGRVIAVDGSQVTPDRHAEVLFGLINTGAVEMRLNSGAAPEITVNTTILFGNDLYPNTGPLMSEGDIALRRDRSERASLLQSAPNTGDATIALADGPLELWGAKDVSDPAAFDQALKAYLGDLREMERRGWTVAGYVDKPGADLVIRFLEVLEARQDDLNTLRSYHPLRGASDRWLFGEILGPEQRSAVFAMQSASRTKYTGGLSLHFFYLNVGSEAHPAIARIEIPQWVADDAGAINALTGVLIQQCRLLASRPYPYILHRAHETAAISLEEKEQIKLRLLLELRRRGIEPELPSAKSIHKSLSQIKGSY